MAEPSFLSGEEIVRTTSLVAGLSTSYDSGATGSDRCLVVVIDNEVLSGAVTGVTYNGVALTEQVKVENTTSANTKRTRTAIWTLADPATGSNTLAFSGYSGGEDFIIYAAVFTDVDQTSPVGATASDGGQNDSTPSISITTTAANSLIVGGFGGWVGSVGPLTPDAGITERYDDRTFNSTMAGERLAVVEKSAASVGSHTVSGTWTGSADKDSALVLIELLEPGGGGITATGDLTATHATASGTASVEHKSTGDLIASNATLSGTATVEHTATGDLTATAATLSGTASLEHKATGDLTATAATVSGTASVGAEITATGDLTATAATVSGTATLEHKATGDLTAANATADGTASVEHKASGDLTAANATVSGTATVGSEVTATGDLTATAATLSGTATVEHKATGDLTAAAATVSGAASVEHKATGDLTATPATVSGSDGSVAVEQETPKPAVGGRTGRKARRPRRPVYQDIAVPEPAPPPVPVDPLQQALAELALLRRQVAALESTVTTLAEGNAALEAQVAELAARVTALESRPQRLLHLPLAPPPPVAPDPVTAMAPAITDITARLDALETTPRTAPRISRHAALLMLAA